MAHLSALARPSPFPTAAAFSDSHPALKIPSVSVCCNSFGPSCPSCTRIPSTSVWRNSLGTSTPCTKISSKFVCCHIFGHSLPSCTRNPSKSICCNSRGPPSPVCTNIPSKSVGCNSLGPSFPSCWRAAAFTSWVVVAAREGWQQATSPSSLVLPPTAATSGSNRSGETVDFSFDFEEEEVAEDVSPAPPPTEGRIDIVVDKNAIRQLDLSAAHAVLRKFVHQIGDSATAPSSDPKELIGRTIGFVLIYERDDPFDPRELSEMPDIRLWFVRLDACYPWLPVVLDWRAGELARYAAMLVPHQMSKRSGLVFNPEALELFAMKKVFQLHPWLKVIGISKPNAKLNDMLKMLGFSVTDELYKLIELHPPP